MRMQPVYLWSAQAKEAVIMRIPSSTLPGRAAHCSDGIHTRLPLLASTLAKVSRVGTRENSQPVHMLSYRAAATRVTFVETRIASTTASHGDQRTSSRGQPDRDDDPFPIHDATEQVAYPLHPAIFVTQ